MGQQGVAWIAAAVGALPDVSATASDRQKFFDVVAATALQASVSGSNAGVSNSGTARCRFSLDLRKLRPSNQRVKHRGSFCAVLNFHFMSAGNWKMQWKSSLICVAAIATPMNQPN